LFSHCWELEQSFANARQALYQWTNSHPSFCFAVVGNWALNSFFQCPHLFYYCYEKFLLMLLYNFKLLLFMCYMIKWFAIRGGFLMFCFCEYTLVVKFVLILTFARLPGVI
jgi:hypothetical protein